LQVKAGVRTRELGADAEEMNQFSTWVVPITTLLILPLLLWAFAGPSLRRNSRLPAVVYLLSLLVVSLSLPQLTRVARFESDVGTFEPFGERAYVADTVAGVMLLRSVSALLIGWVVGRNLRRHVVVRMLLAGGAAVLVEISTLLHWLPGWLASVFLAATSDPRPEWVAPLATTLPVGVAYLCPPLLAGCAASLVHDRLRGGTQRGEPSLKSPDNRELGADEVLADGLGPSPLNQSWADIGRWR